MKRTRHGFTLVELLVVIAILAVLATVSVVGYTSFIQRANESTALQEMTQIRDSVNAEDILNPNFAISGGVITVLEETDEGYDENQPSFSAFVNSLTTMLGADRTCTLSNDNTSLTLVIGSKKVQATWDFRTGMITTGKNTSNDDNNNNDNNNNEDNGGDDNQGGAVACTHENTTKTTNTVPATCTVDGSETVVCECGETVSTTTLPASGEHTWTNNRCECGAEQLWILVTDASILNAGDQIVIVASDYNYALSTTQNTSNHYRGRAEVVKNNTFVTFGDDVQIIILESGTTTSTFGFNVGDGYLYASGANSDNQIETKATLDDNGSWKISIENEIATIIAQGSASRNTIRYNSGSPRFACYALDNANMQNVQIYKLTVVENHNCEDNVTNVEATVTCTSNGMTAGQRCNVCTRWVIEPEAKAALGHTEPNAENKCDRCQADLNKGKTVAFEIKPSHFNTTSYTANNNSKKENGYAFTSNQIMLQSNVMQWKKNEGYITVEGDDANGIVKIEIAVSAGSYTVTVGGSTVSGVEQDGVWVYDFAGKTGDIKISVGGATGKTTSVKFYK